ncbi:MAG: hypothetical protein JO153_14845 [Solirubrobacterales bacterium]|nr:hypothetical protein [Solirubrobacterales bacterium]MBV9917781.1 hypothetical protein [Solirubrobacterales bacterium]
MAAVHRPVRGIRPLAALTACILMLLAAGTLAPGRAAADAPPLTVQVGAAPAGPPMAPGFLGVSFEYKATHLYTGRDPGAVNPVLVALLRRLAPGARPYIRIGGNSTDQTWWPMRHVIPPRGVSYALTKGWLRTTQALAQALHARLILGVNLAAGRPALAVAEARALLAGIGRRNIDAFEIGNEPDLYNVFAWSRDRLGRVVFSRPASYNVLALAIDYVRWRAALPSAPLAGPSFASLSWTSALGSFIASQPRLSLVTFHRYPLRACLSDTTSPLYASIPNLLSDQASHGLAMQLSASVAVAHAHGLPFRLDELNSASCSGARGVSDTFASALWVLDTLFELAANGVDGVNFHTLPGAAYEPFTFTRRGSSWRAFVHPLYYGALAFAQAFPLRARLLPVTVPAAGGAGADAGAAVKVWATQAPDGRIHVVAINKQATAPAQLQLQLPGAPSVATVESLSAPGLGATSGVTLGGQTFGAQTATGVLPPPGATPVAPDPSSGAYNVQVPAGSAVILTR